MDTNYKATIWLIAVISAAIYWIIGNNNMVSYICSTYILISIYYDYKASYQQGNTFRRHRP